MEEALPWEDDDADVPGESYLTEHPTEERMLDDIDFPHTRAARPDVEFPGEDDIPY